MSRNCAFDHDEALKLLKDGVSVAEVAKRYGVTRPAVYSLINTKGVSRGLRAQLRNRGVPGATRAATMNYSPGERAKDLPPERYLNRDPCAYCGVRGDIGCKHRREG